MVKVIATEKGYHGQTIREMGERFEIPDELWNDEKKRPRWVRLAQKALAEALEPDTAGEKPADEPEPKASQDPPKGKEPKGNGVKEALGTNPDWLPPDAVPKAVTE
jgi:hypothetical protein